MEKHGKIYFLILLFFIIAIIAIETFKPIESKKNLKIKNKAQDSLIIYGKP